MEQQNQTPGAQQRYEQPATGQAVTAVGQPDIIKRGIALFIDGVIVGCAWFALSIALGIPLGWLGRLAAAVVAAGIMAARDVLFQGRSPGKKVMGLAAVGPDGSPVSLNQSVMRNSTLALGYANAAVAAVPFLGLLSFPLGLVVLAVGAYEIYLVATNQPRLGDKLAGGTRVVFQGTPAIAI